MNTTSRESACAEPAGSGEVSFLEQALSYADLGWCVFPCKPGSKEPATDHGLLDATRDPEQIRTWWTEHPRYNIAVNCGMSGLVAVDIDVKDGAQGNATWDALLSELGITATATWTSCTPSGGAHLIYTTQESLRSGTNALGPGVDSKSTGGYIVLPFSVTPAGRYKWIEADSDLPRPIMPEIADRLRKPAQEKKVPLVSSAPSCGDDLVVLIQADGHTLTKKGNLDEWCGPCPWCGGHDRFVVGWRGEGRDGGLRYMCRKCKGDNGKNRSGDAVSWRIDQLGQHPVEAKDACGVPVPDEYRHIPASLKGKESSTAIPEVSETDISVHAWESCRFNLETFTMTAPPPTEYLVDKLFELPALSVVSGPAGSLKTMFLLYAMLCVATGRECLGRKVRQGPVAIIDLDNGRRRMHRRLNALARSLDICSAPITTYVFPPLDLTRSKSVAELELIIRRDGLVWVVADTLTNAAAVKDENDAAQFREPLFNARKLVDATGASFGMIHHPPKNGRGLRGSSAIIGAIDEALIVERPDLTKGIINIESIKTRGDDVLPFSAKWVPERDIIGELVGGTFVPMDDTAETATELHRRLIEDLRENGDGGFNQLVRRLKCGSNSLRELLTRLVGVGVVTVKKGPRNGKIYGLKSTDCD